MKLISWNVNGLRACVGKGFEDFFKASDADVFCLQETKLQEGQIDFAPQGYHSIWHYAQKKGYSGTAMFSREEPLQVVYGPGGLMQDDEGRLITAEFKEYYLICEYTPNAQPELKRIDFRLAWDAAVRGHIEALQQKKPVVLCGDLNVAHEEIDLKHPKANRGNPGFSDEERESFSVLLREQNMLDTFRVFNPDLAGAYTWWSYRMGARAKDVGWRIDYFVVSERLRDCLREAVIYKDVMGSDHCPVGLEIEFA